MARCKWCEKGGLFKKVNREGLCAKCEPTVAPDIESHANAIYEAMHVYERAQEDGERIEALDRLLAAAEHLKSYEAKGIDSCNPPPTPVLAEYQAFRDELGPGGG